ncbi:uncharacterized protein LOC144162540 isoform X3 [Haemaphysalis longicornis]
MACTRRCRDVACLGSDGGSKVAFCLYIAQMLSTLCLDGLRGTVCVLVSPTKELAIKSYEMSSRNLWYKNLRVVGLKRLADLATAVLPRT